MPNFFISESQTVGYLLFIRIRQCILGVAYFIYNEASCIVLKRDMIESECQLIVSLAEWEVDRCTGNTWIFAANLSGGFVASCEISWHHAAECY